MTIDSQVEVALRQILYAAIKRDQEAISKAVDDLPSIETKVRAGQLSIAVALYALHEIHSGKPTTDQLSQVADEVAENESWANVTADEARKLLVAALDGHRLDDVLPQDSALFLTFIVTGSLLAGWHRKNEEWWDFLDRAEAAIEADQR